MSALDATATGAIRLAGQQLGVGLTGVPDAEERLKLELQKIVTIRTTIERDTVIVSNL
eukprot:COSAG05_NODE_14971_length_381_cov_4829.780142_1_plen_58_part_00